MIKQKKRDVRRASTISDTAEVMGLSTSSINKVLTMKRNNDKAVEVFMFLTEGKNDLLAAAKKLVPFN